METVFFSMKEASPLKFYFAKFFFLAFGLLQWLCASLLFFNSNVDKTKSSAFFFFTIGLVFISLYVLIADKLKRVSVSKKRIVVMDGHNVEHYEWPEVKYLKMVPYFNLYKLKLKGRKGKIYFLPDQNVIPLMGLFPDQSALVENFKKKAK